MSEAVPGDEHESDAPDVQPDTVTVETTPEGHKVYTLRVTVTTSELVEAGHPCHVVPYKVQELLLEEPFFQ